MYMTLDQHHDHLHKVQFRFLQKNLHKKRVKSDFLEQTVISFYLRAARQIPQIWTLANKVKWVMGQVWYTQGRAPRSS